MSFSYNLSILKGHLGYTGNIIFTIAPIMASPGLISTRTVPDDGQFHHVAVTFNGNKPSSNCAIYLDGELAGGGDAPGVIPNSGSSIAIGRHVDDQGYYSSMELDELGFYNRELTATEIQSIYTASSAGQCKELQIITDLQTTNQTREVTGMANFSTLVSGSGPLTYQWRRNGLPFATNSKASITLTNLTMNDAGNYDVVVGDLNLISVTSQVAVLDLVSREPRYGCLAGWWPGEGNENDALGLSDGVSHGNILFTNGIIGDAFYPNSGYVDLGVGPALNSFTIETWIGIDPAQNIGEQRIVSHDNYTLPGVRNAFMIKSTSAANTGQNGSPWFEIGGPSGWQGLAAPQPLSGGWHHLAGVRDISSGKLELYIDGALAASGSLNVTDTIDSAVSTVLSGVNPSQQIEQFRGLVDEPSIYSCALSSNEIAAIYNTRPVLPQQRDRTIPELTTLVITNTATDLSRPFNKLTYTLHTAPENALINTNTGVIIWTPTELQGPGSNRFVTIVTDNGLPPLSATNSFSVIVSELNAAPQIALPATQTIDELHLFIITATATDPDMPTNTLTFEKVGSTPSGLTVSSAGLIQWTPSEAQGPSSNWVLVRVFDNSTPVLSSTGGLAIVVQEVNSPPVLPTNIPLQTLMVGQVLTVNNTAIDPDLPQNKLIYMLVNPPSGASVTTNGQVLWAPTHAQAGSNYTLRLKVTDDGVPALSATNTFTVEVLSAVTLNISRSLNHKPNLFWNTKIGWRYQIGIKTNINDLSWTELGMPIVATNSITTIADENPGAILRRFYRIEVLSGPQ